MTIQPRFIVLLTAAVACAHAQSVRMPPGMDQVIQALDRTAAAAAKNGGVDFGLAVVTRDGPAWTRSYGSQDGAAQATYCVGQAAFTGVMLLQLMHDGKVHLSDRVDKYFPEISRIPTRYPDAAPLTLVQFATHSTGLDVPQTAAGAFAANASSQWESALLAALPRVRFVTEPGTHVAESGINDAILAAALSRAAGQPYFDYVKQRIFAPLAMSDSHFEPNRKLGEDFTVPVSTPVGDMVKFARFEMLGGPDSVLPRKDLRANYARMWLVNSVSVPNPTEGVGVGYGGETWTSNRNSHYYFIPPIGTQVTGYRASFWFEPRTHAGVVLLQHGDGPALGEMIHSYVYTLNAQKVDAGQQEPQQPVPYRQESVAFSSPAAGVSLSGTLTLPAGNGPFLALVLVQPMGAFPRDEPLLNHRPFLVLADSLTRKGIAVLRYDIRGNGQSGGKFAGATRTDLASDVKAAVAYLRSRPEIDPAAIGLLGQMDGGRTAALAAVENPDVRFLAVLSMPSVPASEAFAERNLINSEGFGASNAHSAERFATDRKIAALIAGETDPAILERKLAEVLTSAGEENVPARLKQLMAPGFRSSLTVDPVEELRKVTCPVLALYGEKDLVIPVSVHAPAMRKVIQAAGNPRSEVHEYPDLNLLLQTADTGLTREAVWAEETIAPAVLSEIADWVLKIKGN